MNNEERGNVFVKGDHAKKSGRRYIFGVRVRLIINCLVSENGKLHCHCWRVYFSMKNGIPAFMKGELVYIGL